MSDVDTRPFKEKAQGYPPELRVLIESCPDQMTPEAFLTEIVRWRRTARIIDTQRSLRGGEKHDF